MLASNAQSSGHDKVIDCLLRQSHHPGGLVPQGQLHNADFEFREFLGHADIEACAVAGHRFESDNLWIRSASAELARELGRERIPEGHRRKWSRRDLRIYECLEDVLMIVYSVSVSSLQRPAKH